MGYRFIGIGAGNEPELSFVPAGDMVREGWHDAIFGGYRVHWAHWADGGGLRSDEVHPVPGADLAPALLQGLAPDLAAADAAGETTDRGIDPGNPGGPGGSDPFILAQRRDAARVSVAPAGDGEGEGRDDGIIGAPPAFGGGGESRAAHPLRVAHPAADTGQGTTLGLVAPGTLDGSGGTDPFIGSYRFIGATTGDWSGHAVASAGDVDGDGKADLMIGAYRGNGFGPGKAYLVLAADLVAADAADGSIDGRIDLDNVNGHTGSYRFIGGERGDFAGYALASAGDVDGDGRDDLIISSPGADTIGGYAGEIYLALAADLAAADAADGVTDGVINLKNVRGHSGSYQFNAFEERQRAGDAVASAGDVDGDGKADVIIGTPFADGGGNASGEAYLITSADLAAADAADGTTDGMIDLDKINGHTGSYRFIGSAADDRAGASVGSAGDVDGDGRDDLIISAPFANGYIFGSGDVYLMNSTDLTAADAADGTTDGVIVLGNVAGHTGSYKFIGEPSNRAGESIASAGDVDGDGMADLILSYKSRSGGGAVLVLAADLAAADAVDGATDGVIKLENVNGHSGSYRFVAIKPADAAGSSVSSAGDVDGDGKDDLIIGARNGGDLPLGNPGEAYLMLAADLAAADAADGATDGVINLGNVNGHTGSYRFTGANWADALGSAVASAGDVDGDGKADLIFGAFAADGGGERSGETFLVHAADLAALDASDGVSDGVIGLRNVPTPLAIARNDAFTTGDVTAIRGLSVFVDNGSGADFDPDGTLSVTAVNGLASRVGAWVELASGALLRVNADGTFEYDPNGQFEDTPLGVTKTDRFTYELNGEAVATATISINGIDNDDVFVGTWDNDVFDGGVGNDTLSTGGGADVLRGGRGIDLLLERAFSSMTITSSQMINHRVTTLDSIERAHVIGNENANRIDASGFAGGSVTLKGRDGNDRLISPDTTGEKVLHRSSNVLMGGAGNDTMIGGTGFDLIVEERNADFTLGSGILTGNGTDSFEGIEAAILRGGSGDNRLDVSGFTGLATRLDGAGGADTLIGGAAMDWVFASADADFVLTDTTLTGDGGDTLVGIDAAWLTGGAGDNRMDVSASTVAVARLTGRGGDDTFIGRSALEDWVFEKGDVDFSVSGGQLAGIGTDTLVDIDGIRLDGGRGANVFDFSGFTGAWAIAKPNGGNDTVIGHAGGIDRVLHHGDFDMVLTDTLLVGGGTITLVDVDEVALFSSASDDRLDASAFTMGRVRLVGGGGDDVLLGGSGNDILQGGSGMNSLFGGDGLDLVFSEGDVDMVLTGTQLVGIGTDSLDSIEHAHLRGGGGNNVLDGSGFDGDVLILEGAGGDDTLIGGAIARDIVRAVGDVDFVLTDTTLDGLGTVTLVDIDQARLFGHSGSNIFDASGFTAGRVQIKAGAGDDVLIGGSAADVLDGGAGADTFWFLDPSLGPDTLHFDPQTDVIRVDRDGFGGLPTGALPADRFVDTGTPLSTGDAVFLYDRASGELSFDADGNGPGGPVVFALVVGAPDVTASNIIVDDFLL